MVINGIEVGLPLDQLEIRIYQKSGYKRICLYCEMIFYTENHRIGFCSEECRIQQRRVQEHERHIRNDGKHQKGWNRRNPDRRYYYHKLWRERRRADGLKVT